MSFPVEKLGAMVFDLAPCAVAVIDRDYNIVVANACVAEDYGAWEGRHCYEVFKRQHRPCGSCAALQTFEDGQVHRTEESGLDKNGRRTYFAVKTAPIFGPEGDVEYVVEMSIDISSYRKLESQHRLLFERVPCFVTVVDRDYRIVDANWRHEETFGDARGRHCYQTYMKAERPCAACPARRTFADGRVHTHQQEALDKKGNRVRFVVHSAPVRDERGEISHVIEMATDVTPLIEMQRKLLLAEGDAALKKAMEMLRDTIGHLRSPLESVAQHIQEGLAAEDVPAVEVACERLQDRIAYLDALRVVLEQELDAETSPRREIDAGEVVARVAARFVGRPAARGILVKGEAASGLPTMHVDQALLESSLICLISDYIAFNVPGVARGAAHHVLLRAEESPAGVVFEVSYRGVRLLDGTEPEMPELARPQGVGMSLAVVQRAIEACGGRIDFCSQPGQGIAIHVELPRTVITAEEGR